MANSFGTDENQLPLGTEQDSGFSSGLPSNRQSTEDNFGTQTPIQVEDSKATDGSDDLQRKALVRKTLHENYQLHKKTEKLRSEIDQLSKQKQEWEQKETKLDEEEKKLSSKNSQLESQIKARKQKNADEKDKSENISTFIRSLAEHSSPERGHMLCAIDIWMEHSKDTFEKAYKYVKQLYKEFAPNVSFPTQREFQDLRQTLKKWYTSHRPPCFIKTVYYWYNKKAKADFPFCFYRFIPGLQEGVSEEFVDRHFYILQRFKFCEENNIIDLFVDKCVVSYSHYRDEGHMCVVSRKEIDQMKKANKFVLWKFRDVCLREHIQEKECGIKEMRICLPRGDTRDVGDQRYKIYEFGSYQDLKKSSLVEPEYKAKITCEDKTQLDLTWKKRDDGEYAFKERINERKMERMTSAELYLLEGKSPFK